LTFDGRTHVAYDNDLNNGTTTPVAMRSSRLSNRAVCKFRRIISQRLLQFFPGHRGHDSIAIREVADANGELRPVGHESTRGKTPRNFTLDPTSTCVLVANQESNTIIPFRRDPGSGRLTATGPVTTTPSPSPSYSATADKSGAQRSPRGGVVWR
jgi:hypothetical protein